MPIRLFGVLLLFFSPALGFATDLMFEGYYKVTLKGESIGYSIQRFAFDPKTKQFSAISFLRIKIGDLTVQESLKALADDKFKPVSYQYTSQSGDALKSIDASFKGEVMTLKIGNGKEVRTEQHKIPKGTFLSTFLTYMLLQKPLNVKTAFKYSGIAEEDGASYWGKTLIDSQTKKAGYTELRVLNQFKGENFISILGATPMLNEEDKFTKAEVISTASPVKSIATELVREAQLATKGHTVPLSTLKSLFGGVPTGQANLLAK